MNAKIPQNKWQRSWVSGKTAARVSGKVLGYLARKPFLDHDQKKEAHNRLNHDSAAIIFQGLTLLRGTSIKIAQQLSLELEIIPTAIRKELEKSYHQIPPINRALARQIIQKNLNDIPENIFHTFESQAFAAASLGQVHRAISQDGQQLAVKIQYPGIDRTIRSDVQMIKVVLRPLPDYTIIHPVLEEIQTRLLEEIDYKREARQTQFYAQRLCMPQVRIPAVHTALSTQNVLTTELLRGKPLDIWLQETPSQSARDHVANTLNNLFLKSLYELGIIHADPNPGNFIIDQDQTVGIVDFGCVKYLSNDFIKCYRQLARIATQGDRKAYFDLLNAFGMLPEQPDPAIADRLWKVVLQMCQWFGCLFATEYFDFSANQGFFAQGRPLFNEIYQLRRHLQMNPNFVFLDRTRYGLLRLFEKMGARVHLRNAYEW